jgi:hypothetical protein
LNEFQLDGSEDDYRRRCRDCDHRSGGIALCSKTQEHDCGPAAKVWARVWAGSAHAWIESGSELSGSREADGKTQHRDLEAVEYERFSKHWQEVQSRFVDSPKGAVTEADDLVSSVMKARGYPVSDFEQRAADISVDHPRMVENYRSAHEIAQRVGKDAATTEDLRTAMIHYRYLFDELVHVQPVVERKEVA